ncbi:hypothetical protein QBC42DRAFT_257945, partial [Cladorrhinum samala]
MFFIFFSLFIFVSPQCFLVSFSTHVLVLYVHPYQSVNGTLFFFFFFFFFFF